VEVGEAIKRNAQNPEGRERVDASHADDAVRARVEAFYCRKLGQVLKAQLLALESAAANNAAADELASQLKDARVQIRDAAPLTVLSIGGLGSYDTSRVAKDLETLYKWLDANPEWETAGEPRARRRTRGLAQSAGGRR
jgi:hypothetical protein